MNRGLIYTTDDIKAMHGLNVVSTGHNREPRSRRVESDDHPGGLVATLTGVSRSIRC